MSQSDQSLSSVFRTLAESIIAQEASSSSDWKWVDKEDETELIIPKINPQGFEVSVSVSRHEITVNTEYLAHQHYTSNGDHREACLRAMALVRDLLAPNMRLRVAAIGGSPYRATLEIFHKGKWQHDGTTGLFVIPWFRKKTEHIYSNNRLPARAFAE